MSDAEQPPVPALEQPAALGQTHSHGNAHPDEQDEVTQDQVEEHEDIFGGDSDLTDIDESDEERPAQPRSATPRSRSASPRSSRSPSTAPSDAGGDDYREEEDDDPLKKLGKIKKKKRSAGDEVEGEARLKKKKSKKQRREEPEQEEEPEEELDPQTRARKDLNARLTAIVKKPSKKGNKKKKQQDEEDLEMMNDEAVATLRASMLQAADRDGEENENGRPAIHKLRMLPQVVELMQKTALAETIVEGGLLEAVKRWLEPLPDKSLPALNIQRPLFNMLRTLSIESSALKSSGLGKVVYFYTKCRRVDATIARLANQLVSDWMRPILRRSKAFVDREVVAAHDAPAGARFGSSSHRAAQQVSQATGAGEGGNAKEGGATRHARIPQALTATFSVAPQSQATGGASGGLPGGSQARMREYKKKLVAGQQAARRV
ncbi:hypothetical protein JCM1841_003391 [Sporobolomyces salmonicolor]